MPGTFSTVSAWLNGLQLETLQPSQLGYTPSITHATLHGFSAGCVPPVGSVIIDTFAVTVTKDFYSPLTITEQPSRRIRGESQDASFTVAASGGTEPYSYSWQYSADGQTFGSIPPPNGVSGVATETLEISTIDSSHAGYYRCVVTDSGSPQEEVVSDAAQLIIVPQLPTTDGCVALDPPPGDFSGDDETGFNLWSWTNFNTWTRTYDAAAGWHVAFYTNLNEPIPGRLWRNDVPIPIGHDTVRITFAQLDTGTYTGLNIRLSWGTGPGQQITKLLSTLGDGPPWIWEVELDENDAWTSVPAVDGYALRDLTVDFLTPGVSGKLKSIDILPGPRLGFIAAPKLITRDGFDLSSTGNYGAGGQMRLLQAIRNHGCDMVSTADYESWRIDFDLCKVGESRCTDAGFNCLGGVGDPSQATVTGWLAAGASGELEMCELVLPNASPENLGDWELRSSFVHHPEVEPASLVFELLEHGTPNLKIDAEITVDAGLRDSTGWTRHGWIETGQPVAIGFGVMSWMYPQLNVPVRVEARAHQPWESVPSPEPAWQTLGTAIVPEIAVGHPDPAGIPGVLESLVLSEDLLPAGLDWALLDLKLTVDPDGLIPEYGEHDNELTLLDWGTLSRGEIGQAVGDQIAMGPGADPLLDFEVNAGQCDTTLSLFSDSLDCYITIGGTLGLRLDATVAKDGEPDPARLVLLRQGADSNVAGVMTRYLRWYGNLTGATVSAASEVFSAIPSDASDIQAPLSSSGLSPTDFRLRQWKVKLWRDDRPVSLLGAYPFLPVLSVYSSEKTTDQWQAIELAVDRSCASTEATESGSCLITPFHQFDLVRTWRVPESAIRDVTPVAIVEYVNGQWQELASSVAIDSSLELGVRIRNIGYSAIAVAPGKIVATLQAPGSPVPLDLEPYGVTEDIVIEGQGSVDVALASSGSPVWTPASFGDHELHVELTTADDDVSNNELQQTLSVGCGLRLVMPTSLVVWGE